MLSPRPFDIADSVVMSSGAAKQRVSDRSGVESAMPAVEPLHTAKASSVLVFSLAHIFNLMLLARDIITAPGVTSVGRSPWPFRGPCAVALPNNSNHSSFLTFETGR